MNELFVGRIHINGMFETDVKMLMGFVARFLMEEPSSDQQTQKTKYCLEMNKKPVLSLQ